MKSWKRVFGAVLIVAMTLATSGCENATVGVGIGVSYPGAYGPYGGYGGFGSPYGWGGTSVYVGGPVW